MGFKLTLNPYVDIILMMLLDGSFDVLKRGLSQTVLRHDLIADNIANVSTTGYKRKDIDFKGMMASNMQDNLPASMTNIRHIPFNTENIDRQLFVTQPNETDIKSDGNNVDLDKEVVNMSNNSGFYNSLATILSKKLRILKTAVSERVV